jgi:hypothetical protein
MTDRDTTLRRMAAPLSSKTIQDMLQTLDENSILLDSKIYTFRNGCILKTAGTDGCITTHIGSIQEMLWYHESRKDRCYFLAKTPLGYLYVSMDLEYLDFLEISVKLYLSKSREDLIQSAMSDAAYKRYIKYTAPIDGE